MNPVIKDPQPPSGVHPPPILDYRRPEWRVGVPRGLDSVDRIMAHEAAWKFFISTWGGAVFCTLMAWSLLDAVGTGRWKNLVGLLALITPFLLLSGYVGALVSCLFRLRVSTIPLVPRGRIAILGFGFSLVSAALVCAWCLSWRGHAATLAVLVAWVGVVPWLSAWALLRKFERG